jgi:hypothetical protein
LSGKVIAFDLDDVICKRDVEGNNIEKYLSCVPIPAMVEIVNNCYDSGNHIIIYTARGMSVFNKDVDAIYKNLYQLTLNHLKEWGVKFHELIMGKVHYDILVDDKAMSSFRVNSMDDIFKQLEQIK